MDLYNFLLNLAEIVIITIGGLFLYSHIPEYFKEKGKNLATKEDIKEITDKIEGIRTDYAKQLLVYQLSFGKKSMFFTMYGRHLLIYGEQPKNFVQYLNISILMSP